MYYIEKEIELLEKKLEDLEDVSLQSPMLDGTPRAVNRKKDPVGNQGTKGGDLQRLIEEQKRFLEEKKYEIYAYIKELDDPLIRLIIMHRCIDLCTWDQVAERIGGSNTAESLRKMFDRHFEKESIASDHMTRRIERNVENDTGQGGLQSAT